MILFIPTAKWKLIRPRGPNDNIIISLYRVAQAIAFSPSRALQMAATMAQWLRIIPSFIRYQLNYIAQIIPIIIS